VVRLFDQINRSLSNQRRKLPGFRAGFSSSNDLPKKLRLPTWSQLRRLPDVLSAVELKIFVGLIIACVMALAWLGIRFYLHHTVVEPKVGGEYVEGVVGNPKYINPVLSQANDADLDLTRLIYSGLFKYDATGDIVPDLAEGYELSEDQKTYTIHLRSGVVWHDGQAFGANDVLTTVDFIQAAEVNSPLEPNLHGVIVESPDDRTVTLTLKEPFAPFLNSLTFGIIPAHIWSDIPATSFALAEANLKPIGTGPFKFRVLKKDGRSGVIRSYEVVRNDCYYNQAPYIEKMTFLFYPDLTSEIDAGKSKKVEGLGYIPKESRTTLEKNREIIAKLLRLPQYTAVFLNQKNSLLKVSEIKQALAYALDKPAIIQAALNGEGEAIQGPILPGYIGYNPEIKKYEYDPAKAMETLDKAGWTVPEGSTLRKKGEQELRFTLTTIDQPDFVTTANQLKDYWEKIGVGVELQIIDSARIEKYVIKPRDYEALLVGEIVGTDPDPYPFWHSSQGKDPGLNLSIFANKDVDQLLEEARKTSDPEQRRMKYLHFQNILAEQLPAIFLYNPTYTYGLAEKIKGFYLERITVPADRFIDVEKWYIKTLRRWR
jgi:peptide/nickel transport system substrate-binding protein